MAKGRAYEDLYARLETKEGEKELYRLARQRDRAGKNVQNVTVIKDENGNVMINSEAVLKRWKEYFEKLMNEENNRDMGKMGIKFLTRLFNKPLVGERMQEEWKRSVLIPIYKNKGDAQCCGNYRAIKRMSHKMKVWEKILKPD